MLTKLTSTLSSYSSYSFSCSDFLSRPRIQPNGEVANADFSLTPFRGVKLFKVVKKRCAVIRIWTYAGNPWWFRITHPSNLKFDFWSLQLLIKICVKFRFGARIRWLKIYFFWGKILQDFFRSKSKL